MPTVKGRWANLMFSQRNNPYCDLLKFHTAKIDIFPHSHKYSCTFLLYLQKIKNK